MRKKLIGIVAVTLLFGLTACGKSSTELSSDTSGEKKVVRYGNADGDSPDLVHSAGIAEAQGYFEEELAKVGYEIEIVGFAGKGPACNEAFAAGELDVAGTGDIPTVTGLANEIGTEIIGITTATSNYSLLVQPDSDITEPKDLEGHSIIVGKGTAAQHYFEELVKSEGIDIDKVEVINATSDASSIFLAKEADAYIAKDAPAFTIEADGNGKVIAGTASGHEEWASQTVLVTRTEFAEENPDAIIAIEKALIRAQQYVEENPEDSYTTLSAGVIDDPELGKRVYWTDNGAFDYLKPEFNQEQVEKLQGVADFMYEQELIRNKINIADYVDNSYYEAAAKELEEE